MVKSVFISQPMNGKSEKEIMKERQRVAGILLTMIGPFNLLDTHFIHPIGTGTPLEYLGESIKYLSQADSLSSVRGGKPLVDAGWSASAVRSMG